MPAALGKQLSGLSSLNFRPCAVRVCFGSIGIYFARQGFWFGFVFLTPTLESAAIKTL